MRCTQGLTSLFRSMQRVLVQPFGATANKHTCRWAWAPATAARPARCCSLSAAAGGRSSAAADRRRGEHAAAAARSVVALATGNDASGAPTASMAGEVCSLKCCLLDVPGGLAEEVAEVLLAYGAQSAAVEEYRPEGAQEQEIFADEHADGRVWDRCTVVAYFPPDEDGAGLLAATAADFGLGQHQQTVEAIRTQDWEQSIKDSYQPAEVGEGLWIVPVWSQPPDPAATNILLEPGLAFGTGDHPTTRLCLRWLRGLQRSGSLAGASVMDYGAGSGVLAVAALLMEAERAVGTDIDPLAVKATAANAQLNNVAPRLASYQCAADLSAQEPLEAAGVTPEQRLFNITVANILQGPLVALAPRLAAYTKPGGLLGLSGILQEQAVAVVEAYSPWFQEFQVQGEDRWALVTAVRRTDGGGNGDSDSSSSGGTSSGA